MLKETNKRLDFKIRNTMLLQVYIYDQKTILIQDDLWIITTENNTTRLLHLLVLYTQHIPTMTYFLTVYTKIRPLSSHKNISYPLLSYRYYKSTVMNTDSFVHAKIVNTASKSFELYNCKQACANCKYKLALYATTTQ